MSTLIRTLQLHSRIQVVFEHMDICITTCWWSPFDRAWTQKRHSLVCRTMSILIRPLCVRVAKPCFPCLPRYHRQTPACSCRQSETHRDSRKRQCFTPQMESMLTEAESYCPTSVDGHFSQAKILVITVRTAHSQIAPTANKPQCYNTADMQQSTNVHDVYHGFKIQAQGQRGIRTEQDTSTCFGTKRQTATQEKTHANQRGMVSREVVGQNRNYWNNPTFFAFFQKKVLIYTWQGLITLDTL